MPTRTSPSTAFVVGLAIFAEGLLTLMDAMIKSLAPRYSAIEIAFLRYAFGMIGAIVYAVATRPGWPTGEATIYNGVRAVLIVFTATTFFFALGKLSLADAIAMSFISPALTAVLGVLLLSERLDWRLMIGLVGGFLGMLLIVGGKLGGAGFDKGVLLGAIAVLLSAIGYSLNVIMLQAPGDARSLGPNHPLPECWAGADPGTAGAMGVEHTTRRRPRAVCRSRHDRRDRPYHAGPRLRARRSRAPRPGRLCHAGLGRAVRLSILR